MRGVTSAALVLASALFTLGASDGSPPPAAPAAAHHGSPCREPLPSAELAAPAGNGLQLQLEAVGVQIYTCTTTATGDAWVFTAPEATLFAAGGGAAGKHYAGPTWEAQDGSTVVGARVAAATPEPSAIPWLLLRATSHGSNGKLGGVTFIQRVATSGGVPPASGCSAATAGAVAKVPYRATYCFYEAG
jgi:FtsP/CotA-like multicopper oxidase with cupredoxin domain